MPLGRTNSPRRWAIRSLRGTPTILLAARTTRGTCVFPNAVIPQSAWSPVAANTLKYVPPANGTVNGCPGFATSAFNATLTDDKGSGRIDVPTRIGAVFGYYFFDRYDT